MGDKTTEVAVHAAEGGTYPDPRSLFNGVCFRLLSAQEIRCRYLTELRGELCSGADLLAFPPLGR
jgi:hypothetical protein